VKIDLHTHTSHGSACSYMDPDQLILRAKAVGLDGVCITEHDHVWDPRAIERLSDRHDFLVIGGTEVSTDCGHVLVYGLHQSVRDIYYLEELRRMVEAAGAVMIMAHPFRYEPNLVELFARAMDTEEMLDDLCERAMFQGLDALEICNGRSGFREKDLATLVASRLNLRQTGGSDAHAALEVGSCYSFFVETIRGEEDFIAQIKQGAYRGVDPRWQQRQESHPGSP
jgi:predicted metal-dependent phosphoesterase TrpH